MDTPEKQEQAIFIGILEQAPDVVNEYDWAEFIELARTAGAVEAGRVLQSRANPDPAWFLGSGKAQSLGELVRDRKADLVIAMQELTPVQIRNLEDITQVKVLDRTDLILDIFAERARTGEGKLQVELAQLKTILPRMSGAGAEYSRLGGGIGTRGPGETKLETDRRRIKRRITELQRELANVVKHRNIQRHRREKNEIATVALIGYTNAGKSTLFNRLTESEVSAQNRLFDTLDPVSRRVKLPGGRDIIVMDTVGFIRNLPHQLIAAFKATLEETVRATLLLHVLDAGAPAAYLEQHYLAVKSVLKELGIERKEMLTVLNKVDLIDSKNAVNRMALEWSALPVSAIHGTAIEELIGTLEQRLSPTLGRYRIVLPFAEAGLLDGLHQKTRVLEENYTNEGIELLIECDAGFFKKYEKFATEDF
jgi:GTP-binding protein HflX